MSGDGRDPGLAGTFGRFCLSSGAAFLLDNAVFRAAAALLAPALASGGSGRAGAVFWAFAAARLVSANFNYFCNRRFVFRSDARAGSYFAYWGLALLVAALSYAGVAGAAALFDLRGGWALTACKVAVETVLFVLSFTLQRTRIFAPRG